MKNRKPYTIYNAHIPNETWAKMERELKKVPQLKDRRNSYNRIICTAVERYFERHCLAALK